MKQELFQVTRAGGVQTRLPPEPNNAAEAVNLVVDRRTGGWSTRLGYEPYFPDLTNLFSPFNNVGPITSLHIAQALAGGARQHTFFESEGSLFLLYDAASPATLLPVATGRHVPTPTEAGSWYTDTPYGTVITNGVDRPIIVQPWPLGTVSQASATRHYRAVRPPLRLRQPAAEPRTLQGDAVRRQPAVQRHPQPLPPARRYHDHALVPG
jgi:hypothetical protein